MMPRTPHQHGRAESFCRGSSKWGYRTEDFLHHAVRGSVRPPTFIVFTDKAGDMHFSAERFLINRLREKFGFEGTPIVIKTKRR